MRYFVGVDIGGTFTDVAVWSEEGGLWFDKAFSTRPHFGNGVIRALENCAEKSEHSLPEILSATERFGHATTVGTNALIEKKGANVALIITRGFEDTTVIMRGPMGRVLGLPREKAVDYIFTERPDPLPNKRNIFGVTERVDAEGNRLVPLNESETRRVLETIVGEGIRSVAVCFLWSFKNPVNEQRVAEIAREIDPSLRVNLSSEVSPLLGEFERATTTVVNAYLEPIVSNYALSLEEQLQSRGLKGHLLLMKSSGGTTLSNMLRRDTVATTNSGPVGGLLASRYLGQMLGYPNVVCTDVGGTSFDVGIIHGGEFVEESTTVAGQGMPIQVPALKTTSIGAGGGSIARTDGVRLMVGPASAGSNPGPACYDNGGVEPTLTDAMVVLGYISPENFFGTRKVLNREAAERALYERVARPLGMDLREAAMGIYEIATAKMADLIRQETVKSGYDPRQFVMFAYGGAGPGHAALYGHGAGIATVIVPPTAAVFSALGIALADIKYTYSKSVEVPLDSQEKFLNAINSGFQFLEESAWEDIRASGIEAGSIVFIHKCDLRYEGQMREVTVAAPHRRLSPDNLDALRGVFERNYAQVFGAATVSRESNVEVATLRLEALSVGDKPALPRIGGRGGDAEEARTGTREVYFKGPGLVNVGIYAREKLGDGSQVAGPAIVEARDHVTVVPPGFQAAIDGWGNLILTRRGN